MIVWGDHSFGKYRSFILAAYRHHNSTKYWQKLPALSSALTLTHCSAGCSVSPMGARASSVKAVARYISFPSGLLKRDMMRHEVVSARPAEKSSEMLLHALLSWRNDDGLAHRHRRRRRHGGAIEIVADPTVTYDKMWRFQVVLDSVAIASP